LVFNVFGSDPRRKFTASSSRTLSYRLHEQPARWRAGRQSGGQARARPSPGRRIWGRTPGRRPASVRTSALAKLPSPSHDSREFHIAPRMFRKSGFHSPSTITLKNRYRFFCLSVGVDFRRFFLGSMVINFCRPCLVQYSQLRKLVPKGSNEAVCLNMSN